MIEGIIKPPPEIRAVADRTALYVAKNGRAFESRILNSEKGRTPKFAFLQPSSPFHAYYEDKVKFYENGGTDESEKKEEEKKEENKIPDKPSDAEKKEKTQRASAIDPISKALLDQRAKILQRRAASEQVEGNEAEKPDANIPPTSIRSPNLQFINIVAPASLSIADVETIQLVAQFTALDGRNGTFLSQLIHREWNNPRFGFAQPRHGHFAYFSSLVDAYRVILRTWSSASGSSDDIKDLSNNVDKCLETAAYWAEYERDKEDRARDDDALNPAAMIDWHDFIVVETIHFAPQEIVEAIPPPPPPTLPAIAAPKDDEMDVSDEEDEQIRVVSTYEPKIATQSLPDTVVIDPITGKAVAAKDMSEHMRIQLLDPKWAEEKKKFQDKQKDSNLVSGDVVADNLARFTQAIGESRDQGLLSEADSRKKLEEANRVLRQQGQSTTVGPALPHTHKVELPRPAPTTGEVEPAAKRTRVQVTHIEAPTTAAAATSIPPTPGFESSSLPTPDEPFAAAVTTAMTSADTHSGSSLLPEAEFAASLAKPEVTLQIRIPNDRTQIAWNFYGQIVAQTANVMSTIKVVKQELAQQYLNSMPINKIQLKNQATGAFLKDNLTLAALNLGPTASLELVPRARGGGRK